MTIFIAIHVYNRDFEITVYIDVIDMNFLSIHFKDYKNFKFSQKFMDIFSTSSKHTCLHLLELQDQNLMSRF